MATQTVDDIDRQLLTTHTAYLRAERRGSVAEAAELWAKLDALLEQRIHIPCQRKGQAY